MSTHQTHPIVLTNTLTGQKESLIPVHPGEIRMYVCGPTVYNLVHIGNARPAIIFDAMRRFFEYRGYRVFFVQNFTDIDDKIIQRMNREGWDFDTITATYIREYRKDMQALGVREPNFAPRTSHYVPQTIRFVQGLIEKGHAYVSNAQVFFSVPSFPNYGALSHRKVEDLLAGARIDVDPDKRHPADFSLWKNAKPGEPSWDSPWGPGRPGWHIECSVMACVLLGDTFDIHAGGNDLIFPHHENEKAQSEALTGKTFASLWLHNGMLQMDGSKMAKSLGNIIKIREAVRKYGADGLKLYMFATHYRSPMDYSEERMDEWKRSAVKVRTFLTEIEETLGDTTLKAASDWLEEKRAYLMKALSDDFNTPKAVALVFETLKELGPVSQTLAQPDGESRLRQAYYLIKNDIGDILGLFEDAFDTVSPEKREDALSDFNTLMDVLVRLRDRYRSEKNEEMSDILRRELEKLRIKLMDGTEGARWTRSPGEITAERREDILSNFNLLVDFLVRLRDRYRSEKNEEMSDILRQELGKLRIKLMDGNDGTRWTRS